jgi:hypothetical protein
MAEGGAGVRIKQVNRVEVNSCVVEVVEIGSGATTKKDKIMEVAEWKSQRTLFPRPKTFITLKFYEA